ncbi:hypothetical protein [Streptomyces lydicus]|nr:hypothetical protein [Streptomyces lydicus]
MFISADRAISWEWRRRSVWRQEHGDNARSQISAANYDAARFSGC